MYVLTNGYVTNEAILHFILSVVSPYDSSLDLHCYRLHNR